CAHTLPSDSLGPAPRPCASSPTRPARPPRPPPPPPTRRSSDLGAEPEPRGQRARDGARHRHPRLHARVEARVAMAGPVTGSLARSEEHTSELQSRFDLVCRLLLEKKKKKQK